MIDLAVLVEGILLIHEQLEILLRLHQRQRTLLLCLNQPLGQQYQPSTHRRPLCYRPSSAHQWHRHHLQGLQAIIVMNDLAHTLLQELIQIGFLNDGAVDARIGALTVGADGDEIRFC